VGCHIELKQGEDKVMKKMDCLALPRIRQAVAATLCRRSNVAMAEF